MDTDIKKLIAKELRARLRGKVISPIDNEYNSARKIWNCMIDKYPVAIAYCAGVADVINTVNFARAENFLVAIRSGGHNVAGNAVCDDGIVLDLSRMKGIYVNPDQHTVRVQAGVTIGEFDHETQFFGLATTGGASSTTGIAGFTLGGGLGWLMGKYGLSCDNLLSADVVTADGHFLKASATENEDLFWGLKGGGGNFGIATSFEFQLHPVKTVIGGTIIYPFKVARDFLRFYRDFLSTAPDELMTLATLYTAPDGTHLVGIVVCYCDSLEKGEKVLKPLKDFGLPVADLIQPMPYLKLQGMWDDMASFGRQHYWKANCMQKLNDDIIDIIIEGFRATPSPLSSVNVEYLHGVACRIDPSATAFVLREEHYTINIISTWLNSKDTEKNIQWNHELSEAVKPFSNGKVYINYLGNEGEERVKDAYKSNYEKLVLLKKKYDPTNFFRVNQNIRPTT
jgi:FAD/FMN-containing dehydrogenase